MARKRRTTNTWLCSNGVHLDVTAAKIEQQPSAHWWWPLHRVSRSAMHAGLPWPIHLDEFRAVGYHDRSRSLGIWVYVHARTGAEIFVDGQGQTYRQTPLRDEPIRGRFTKCDGRAAAERARLHLPEARAQTRASGIPLDAGFDPGQCLSDPRALTPGRRVDAMRKARSVVAWDVEFPPAQTSAAAPLSPRSGPPPSYIVVRPGPPRTHDFAERWEPKLLLNSSSAMAALDAIEERFLRDDPRPAARPGPAAQRRAHPSGGKTPPKPPRSTPGASAPRLRQVWPPPTRPRRWSSY